MLDLPTQLDIMVQWTGIFVDKENYVLFKLFRVHNVNVYSNKKHEIFDDKFIHCLAQCVLDIVRVESTFTRVNSNTALRKSKWRSISLLRGE